MLRRLLRRDRRAAKIAQVLAELEFAAQERRPRAAKRPAVTVRLVRG